MVLTHPFHCPTRIVEGHGFGEAVAALVNGRRWAVVTSRYWRSCGAADRLASDAGAPEAVIDDVPPNPTISTIIAAAPHLPAVDAVVALGGGSVIDAAKGMIALQGVGGDEDILRRHLSEGEALPPSLDAADLIAVPTTAGTGSEVTRWGTVWGDDGIKFSVTDPKLYPSHAVLDPELTKSMPRELTLSTGLDALSHSMESIWNRRHASVSDALAVKAIATIMGSLQRVLADPEDGAARREMQMAAVIAGLAMGTTQTALAHSISYPFTSRFHVPHGLACSFTLPEVIRYNAASAPDRIAVIAGAMGCPAETAAERLEEWFDEIGLGPALSSYVSADALDSLDAALITRARAANNIREADAGAARDIAERALARFCGVLREHRITV